MKRYTKGFTLIELLVVIAIIGILASVVLVSLGTARSKANDGKVQEQLASMRAQAELYTGTGTAVTPAVPCVSPGTNTLFETANNGLGSLLVGLTLTNTRCYSATGKPSDGVAWAVSAYLPTGTGYWCVDNTGVSKFQANASYLTLASTITTSCN